MSSGGLTAQQFNKLGDEYDAQQELAAAAFVQDTLSTYTSDEIQEEMLDLIAQVEDEIQEMLDLLAQAEQVECSN